MMKSWSFILVVLSVNLILTNGEEQIQQVVAELKNQTSGTRQEEIDEIGKILKNVEAVMDPTVDPCGNFYQFVCGKFTNESLSPYDDAVKEIKTRLISKYEQEEPLESENKLSLIKHSRNLYKSCKKTKNEKSFNDFILRDLEAIGGWPALKGNSWNSSSFDWKHSVQKIGNHNIWINYLFNIKLYKTGDKIFLELGQVIYDNERAVELAGRLAGNNSIVKEELEKVNEFSKTFLKEYFALSNVGSNPTTLTLQNLTDKYPYYPWTEYLKYNLPNIQPTDIIVLHDGSAVIENLFSFLNNTDQRMLANIVASIRAANLDEYFMRYDLFEDCFELVSRVIRSAPSLMFYHEFIHNNISSETKQLPETISNKIREQFIKMLGNADSISNKTNLIEKLEKLSYQFGFSPDSFKDNLLNEYYDELQSNHTYFYDALYNVISFQGRVPSNQNIVKHRDDIKEYYSDAYNIPDAEYQESINSILVRWPLLQRQFIDINHPTWLNSAWFGSIIGHEFGRAWDPKLNKANADGKGIRWPENFPSYIEYMKKYHCLNDMYRDIANLHYKTDEQPYRHGLDITINAIADNLGLKATYLAYENSLVKENNQTLYQKEYSPDQLFWIATTHRFCKHKPQVTGDPGYTMRNQQISQYTNELRILGLLSNSDEFARDFNCPTNSQMYRQQKCSVF